MNTAVATAYDCRAVWHPARHARKSRNAQKSSGFRASGTYGHCIKDHVLIDPCCGSGGMFVQSARFVESHSGNINNIAIYGQDSNPTTWKMAQMNLAIRGIEPDLGSYAADTFLDDRHPTMRADYIMANPPFNLSDWGADKLKDDVRWQYGMPPAGNANFAWLQHMIYHLAPAGKIGMVLANGSLSSQSGGEGEIRKNIINADLVECIIAMPTQLFYTTQIPVGMPAGLIRLLAFVFGFIAVLIAILLPRLFRNHSALTLVLSGIIVGSFMDSILALIKYIADRNEKLADIVFWIMGSMD